MITFAKNIYTKAAVLIFSCAALLTAFGYAIVRFYPAEPEPSINLIDMQMRKKIRNFAAVVKTGLYIKNFEVFDVRKDRFVFGGVVWFEFNTDEVMQETIERFSFVGGKLLSKSPGDIRVTDKTMFIKYDIRAEVKSQLAYHRFPFDDHRLSLMITNEYVTPSELYFTVDNSSFGVGQDTFAANWKLHTTGTLWGYSDLNLDEHDKSKRVKRPVVAYTVNFVKSGLRYIIIIFLPLFITLLLGFMTFMMDIGNAAGRFRTALTALTAILSYRFVVDRMMPSIGYFTTTDVIYALWFMLIFTIFLLQVVLGRFTLEDKKRRSRAELIDICVFYVVSFACAILSSWFLIQ